MPRVDPPPPHDEKHPALQHHPGLAVDGEGELQRVDKATAMLLVDVVRQISCATREG